MITLPESMPIFPLTGTILLPGQLLPLNMFEERYVAMAKYAHTNGLPIGMIQPMEAGGALFEVGCAGNIIEFQETDDGRIELILEGTRRFTVTQELPMHDGGFRLVTPDGARYAESDKPAISDDPIQSTAVAFATKRLMEGLGMQLNVDSLEEVSGEELVDVLSVMIPFPPEDKQALLETDTVHQRFALMQQFVTAYTTPEANSQALH